MSRPTSFTKDKTLYWTVRLYTSAGALVDADSTPTVAVRKNGASDATAVTVTKRTSTTGIYDCSFNPASEVEGDQFTFEESATISSTAYSNSWECTVTEVERGTDSAYTGTPPAAGAIADAVWDEARADHTTAGTYGEHTGDAAMRGTDSAYTGTPPTAGAMADAVWDEARSGHTTAGTYGEHTGDAAMRGTDGANTTTPPTTEQIRDALLDRVLNGNHDTADTLGKIIQDLETELAKVPRQGSTHKHRQVSSNTGNKSADVIIEAAS